MGSALRGGPGTGRYESVEFRARVLTRSRPEIGCRGRCVVRLPTIIGGIPYVFPSAAPEFDLEFLENEKKRALLRVDLAS
jgi:hypothetical protein